MPASPQSPIADLRRISRRDFGRHAALAAALSMSPAELATALHHFRNHGSDGPQLTPQQTQEVDAKLANIIRKYGNRLSDEQRQHLRRILGYNERMLASVRAFPLQNGDPPASVLRISYPASSFATEGHNASEEGKP